METKKILIGAGIAVAVGAAGYFGYTYYKNRQQVNQAQEVVDASITAQKEAVLAKPYDRQSIETPEGAILETSPKTPVDAQVPEGSKKCINEGFIPNMLGTAKEFCCAGLFSDPKNGYRCSKMPQKPIVNQTNASKIVEAAKLTTLSPTLVKAIPCSKAGQVPTKTMPCCAGFTAKKTLAHPFSGVCTASAQVNKKVETAKSTAAGAALGAALGGPIGLGVGAALGSGAVKTVVDKLKAAEAKKKADAEKKKKTLIYGAAALLGPLGLPIIGAKLTYDTLSKKWVPKDKVVTKTAVQKQPVMAVKAPVVKKPLVAVKTPVKKPSVVTKKPAPVKKKAATPLFSPTPVMVRRITPNLWG